MQYLGHQYDQAEETKETRRCALNRFVRPLPRGFQAEDFMKRFTSAARNCLVLQQLVLQQEILHLRQKRQ